MQYIAALFVLLFSTVACTGQPTVTHEYREPVMTSFHLIVVRNEELPQGIAAYATWNQTEKWCVIEYREAYYSNECLGHELRHCLEGHWHGKDKVSCTSQEQERQDHE